MSVNAKKPEKILQKTQPQQHSQKTQSQQKTNLSQKMLKQKFEIHQTKNPLISVVIPTYNSMKYLPKAIESVLTQTYKNFELIVVNDASTDETEKYLSTMRHPKLTIIHHKTNKKLPTTLNTGFKKAKGEYFTWVSADNLCTKNFLSEMVKQLKYFKDAKFIYSDYFLINDKGEFMKDYQSGAAVHDGIFDGGGARYSFRKSIIENGGVAAFLYHKSCLRDIGKYDKDLVGTEDWDYWIRIAQLNPMMPYIPKPLMQYRIHSESMTFKMKNTVAERESKMIQKRLKDHGPIFSLHALFPSLRFTVDKYDSMVLCWMQYAQELVLGRYTKELGLKYQQIAMKMNKNSKYKIIGEINLAMMTAINGDLKKAKLMIEEIKKNGNYENWKHKLDFVEFYELILKSKRKQRIKFIPLDQNEEIFHKDNLLQLSYDTKKNPKHSRRLGLFLPPNLLELWVKRKINIHHMFDTFQFFDKILILSSDENQINLKGIVNFDDSYQLMDLIKQENLNFLFFYKGNNTYCENISKNPNYQMITYVDSNSISGECLKSDFFITSNDGFASHLVDSKVSKHSIFTLPSPNSFEFGMDEQNQEGEAYSIAFILLPNLGDLVQEFIKVTKEKKMGIVFVKLDQLFNNEDLLELNKLKEFRESPLLQLSPIDSIISAFSKIPLIYMNHVSDDSMDFFSQMMGLKNSILISLKNAPIIHFVEDEITGILINDAHQLSDGIQRAESSLHRIINNLKTHTNVFNDPKLNIHHIYRMIETKSRN
jgi:glycosyltransferase involved in cell wall biosynthesis